MTTRRGARYRRAAGPLTVALVLLAGCGYPDYEFVYAVADAGPDRGVADARPDAVACPVGAPGPAMVNVGPFCIDSTEVTNEHYASFLAAAGTDRKFLPTYCSFTADYRPRFEWPAKAGLAKHPVLYVTWCQAHAYCKWAGKRLCGGIAGGRTPSGGWKTAGASQWHHACTNNGKTSHPYGNTFDPNRCNGAAFDAGVPKFIPSGSIYGDAGSLPVKTATDCRGSAPPFDGVYDLVGNVSEWEDDCSGTTGPDDSCRIRGGGWANSDTSKLSCGAGPLVPRREEYSDVGIRCCAP